MQITGEITYTRKRQIGVGQGMNSKVFLVDDPQLCGEFAVKEIEKRKLGNDVSKFWVEAQAMNAVGHPNVVPIRAAFQTKKLICIAMDYYRDGSLADKTLIGPIPVLELIRIGEGVLNGVASIHNAGYIHFDIKPSNVFLDDNLRPLVADLGQARKIGPNGVTFSPAMYLGGLPPECYSGIGLEQSDVYQVGLTLYRAANGDDHFNAQLPSSATGIDEAKLQDKTVRGKFPNRQAFLPHVPRAMRTVIRTALHVSPSGRYPSATAMADALGKVTVTHNWKTTISPTGSIAWRSSRSGHPDIVVDCLNQSARIWDVEIWGEGPSGRRRRSSAHWKSSLSQSIAFMHLKDFFHSLE